MFTNGFAKRFWEGCSINEAATSIGDERVLSCEINVARHHLVAARRAIKLEDKELDVGRELVTINLRAGAQSRPSEETAADRLY